MADNNYRGGTPEECKLTEWGKKNWENSNLILQGWATLLAVTFEPKCYQGTALVGVSIGNNIRCCKRRGLINGNRFGSAGYSATTGYRIGDYCSSAINACYRTGTVYSSY